LIFDKFTIHKIQDFNLHDAEVAKVICDYKHAQNRNTFKVI